MSKTQTRQRIKSGEGVLPQNSSSEPSSQSSLKLQTFWAGTHFLNLQLKFPLEQQDPTLHSTVNMKKCKRDAKKININLLLSPGWIINLKSPTRHQYKYLLHVQQKWDNTQGFLPKHKVLTHHILLSFQLTLWAWINQITPLLYQISQVCDSLSPNAV